MKNLKNLVVTGAAMLFLVLGFNASAQRGFDEFSGATTVQLLNATYVTSQFFSNSAVDEHVFAGIAKIDVSSTTNGVAGNTALWLYGSPDLTNWTALANYALGTNYAVKMTNFMYGGTNLYTTNNYVLSYVPTAGNATNGFMNTYPVYPAQEQFTNTFASGPLILKTGTYTIAYNVDDAPRYMQMVFSNGGSGITNTLSAMMTTQIANQYHVVP
jgi:hypothetical protein